MKNGKLLSFSSALVILQLAGCSYDYPTFSQQMGWSDRTLPQDSSATFDNRHIVPLNPSPRSHNTIVKVPAENGQAQAADDANNAPQPPAAVNVSAPVITPTPVPVVETAPTLNIPTPAMAASSNPAFTAPTTVPATPATVFTAPAPAPAPVNTATGSAAALPALNIHAPAPEVNSSTVTNPSK